MYDKIKLENVSVIDIEANGLDDATEIHLIAILEDGHETVYRNLTGDKGAARAASDHLAKSSLVAGHNILGFDAPTLSRLCGIEIECPVLDTLVLSRLINFGVKGGHSLEAWGERLGIRKEGTGITDWSRWTPEMESRCLSDVKINFEIVKRYHRIWSSSDWQSSLKSEHFVARMCKVMHDTGFPFDRKEAVSLRETLASRVADIDRAFESDFPPRAVAIREITPRRTKSGTLDLSDFRWFGSRDLSSFDGGPFTRFEYVPFNPGSPRQVVERLNEVGWKPTEKTDGHVNALKDKSTPKEKLEEYRKFGWKINEANLQTVPDTAPPSAKRLAERIVLASRLSDLDEWLDAVGSDGSIHGSFQSIGAWTERVSHQKPNTANIPQSKPSDKDTPFQKEIQILNGKMRSLFRAREGWRLIGTDADGIQMRIFAHLCKDERLIDALVNGSKENKTDIHSLNQSLLGSVCGSRDVAKTFIYAFLLGAGAARVAEILGCSFSEAKASVAQFVEGLPGLSRVKKFRIPQEAKNGYFVGLDGRKVICDSEHLMLSGHLQNGEKVIMSHAMEKWVTVLTKEKVPFLLHNWVHDEWQTGCPDDDDICAYIQQVQLQALLDTGVELGLCLPTPGSSDWGYTWKDTH